jgi:phosphate-selective porin OprO/OprP
VHSQRIPKLMYRALLCGLAALLFLAPTAGSQSPPPWPTRNPVPATTPAPSPTPEPAAPAATAVPSSDSGESSAGHGAGSGTQNGGNQTSADSEVSSVDDESLPKAEQVTNPGAVAFTDYRPFDLDEIEPEKFDSKWKQFAAGLRGLGRYNLFDGDLKFRIGGKGQFDGTAGSGDTTYDEAYQPIESSFKVRRFELFAAGRVKKFNFNLEFEFGPDWGISNAWIEGAEGGLEVWGAYLGKLRVGLMNEPFSLERQTSSYNTGFLERSLPVQTIAPGSNIGAMVHDSGPKGRFTWAVGLFSFGQQNEQNATTSALSLTGRYTYLPMYRGGGRELIHVGVSLSSRSPTGGDLQYRSRPEARFVDYLVDTGNFEVSKVVLWGLEFATIQGPLWVAAEYIQSDVSAQAFDNPNLGGAYVQVGWFLTGESKPYRTNSGTFDRVQPERKYSKGNPFKKKNGGAWELVGRVSTIDLTDGLIDGGKLADFSASLNWYVNATTRVEFNYIYANPRDNGAANIFLMRLQYQPW